MPGDIGHKLGLELDHERHENCKIANIVLLNKSINIREIEVVNLAHVDLEPVHVLDLVAVVLRLVLLAVVHQIAVCANAVRHRLDELDPEIVRQVRQRRIYENLAVKGQDTMHMRGNGEKLARLLV